MKSVLSKINPAIVLVFLSVVGGSCSTEPGSLGNEVETGSGVVQGVVNETGTVTSFKGIPYAAPPVADLRWREPQAYSSWEGVRDASEFGVLLHDPFMGRNPVARLMS